jgi:DNA polymerase delta subunit 2
VVCGDLVSENKTTDKVERGSYSAQAINKNYYEEVADTTDRLEDFMALFIDSIDVDIMPGVQDFSNSFLPQQPLNSFMFPKIGDKSSLNLVTNPHKFEAFKGIEFLGTSGQNLRNIEAYCDLEASTGLDLLKLTLDMRHLCPTAPDTLRTFPFRENDPFVIERAPDVYFAGNQDSFGAELVTQTGNSRQGVQLISVPTFAKTLSIVLMDTQTLESFELKFN